MAAQGLDAVEEGQEHEETAAPLFTPRGKRPIKTALHQAVLDLRIHQVRLLVEKHGANVDSKDMYGRTPLMLACLLENGEYGLKMMRIFLKAGARINIKDNMKRTVLHYACMKGRQEMARRLTMDDTIALSDGDNDGNTPLMLAALGGNPSIVEHLVLQILQFGLSCDARNKMGYTALMLACKYGHYVSAYILVTKGAAQHNLRDNEFFLTSVEWVHKSGVLHAAYPGPPHRSHTAPPASRFDREHSLYMDRFTPKCCHVKSVAHPLGQSLDSALHLPALFSKVTIKKPVEGVYQGVDARNLLLKEMEDQQMKTTKSVTVVGTTTTPSSKKYPPGSRVSSVFTTKNSMWTQRSVASTRQILAVAPKSRSSHIIPDMKLMFKLYSEQYDADSPKFKKESSNLPDLHVQFTSPCRMSRKSEPTIA